MTRFPEIVIRPWGHSGPDKMMVRNHIKSYLLETGAGDATESNVDLLYDRGLRAVSAGYPTIVARVDDAGGDDPPCSILLCGRPEGGVVSTALSTAEIVLSYTDPDYRRQGIREAMRELALRWLRKMEVKLVIGAARFDDAKTVEDLTKHGAKPLLVVWGREP